MCGRDVERFLNSDDQFLARGKSGTRNFGYKARLYDPDRCIEELQEQGDLLEACAEVAQKAFRILLTTSGAGVLALAGDTRTAGRAVPWPQVRQQR